MSKKNQRFLHEGKVCDEEEMQSIVLEYEKSIFSDKNGRYSKLEQILPSNASTVRILDYGCGLGCVSEFFSKKYESRIDAVDISSEEVKKAKLVYGRNEKITFMDLTQFDFPKAEYDLIFSSQVIEHVHNPGIYLSRINKMLKENGVLIIGLPNLVNRRELSLIKHYNMDYALRHSKNMVQNYNKASDHINGWDPHHFITLLASCGFELEKYIPAEGVPRHILVDYIPFIGSVIGRYGDKSNRGFSKNLSYTMLFRFKKVKEIEIQIED